MLIIHKNPFALHPRARSLHQVQLSDRRTGGKTLDQRVIKDLGGEQKEIAQEEQMEKDYLILVPCMIEVVV